jgi:DnaJ homolog subfamily A member 2
VQQKKHEVFTRKGNNLWLKHKITLKEALIGFSFHFKHLDGRVIKVESSENEIIRPGDIKCIRGEGLPIFKSEKFGDLFIEFEIIFPKEMEISKEEKEDLSKILSDNEKLSNKHVTENFESVSKTTNLSEVSEMELKKLKNQENYENQRKSQSKNQGGFDEENGPGCQTQ